MSAQRKKKETNSTDSSSASFHRFLGRIERIGNAFPHPFMLFIICSVIVLLAGELLKGTTFTIPGENTQLQVVSLLNREGFGHILSSLLKNFINFPLIPLIFVFTLAIGVGEKSGFYHVIILKFFHRIPDFLLYFIFIFVAINGNIISDAALILLPAIGSMLFISKGKNPILAIMLSYAGYLAGLSANTIIAGTDVLVAGITEDSLSFLSITKDLTIHPACNWYFMMASSVLLSLSATWVTIRFVEPLLPAVSASSGSEVESADIFSITPEQNHGLRYAFFTTVIYFAVVLSMMLLPDGWLRDLETGTLLPSSPFLDNITVILAIYFFLVGLLYGIGAGTIRSSFDVADGMLSGIKNITGLLVVFFFAAQFVDYFSQTNLAPLLAIRGAGFLQEHGFTGMPLLILIILLVAVLNFFIGTVGSKWSMMAPVLVPMFALLGYHPAFAQCVYRIGDAVTNTVNPISVYIPMLLMYMRKYKKDAGIGTIVAYQIPYAICFFITWTLQLLLWFCLDLPLGPLSPIRL